MNAGNSVHIMNNYDDLKQELHIHIYTKVLPVINIDKIQAIQNFIYISVKNKLINILTSLDNRTKIKYDFNDYNMDEERLIAEEEPSCEDIIQVINNRIALLKKEQPSVKCVTYYYLEHLEQYINQNDYNAAGFKEYCMNQMKIGNSQFMNLSHRLGFKTIAFKSKKKEI